MKKKALFTVLSASLMCAAAAVTLVACGGGDEATKYKVTYAGGGTTVTGNAPTEADHAKDEKFTLKENTFTNTGYQFDGWTYGGNTYEAGAQFTMPESDVTFTAKWLELFTVTYSWGENKPAGAAEAATLPTAVDVADGKTVTLPTLAAADSFTFSGWKVGETAEIKAGGTIYTVRGDITLTAMFVREGYYKVTYSLGEHASAEATVPTQEDTQKDAEVTLANDPVAADGWRFAGWEVKQGETDVVVSEGKFKMPEGNVTITAKWEEIKTFDVKVYLADDDTEAAKTVTVEEDVALGNALDEFKVQKGITSFYYLTNGETETAVTNESVISELVSEGQTELKVYAKYTINVATHAYTGQADWTATLNKGEVLTLKGTQGSASESAKTANYQSAVLYLYAGESATDAIRSDWCINPATGKSWANGTGKLADDSTITALVGPAQWDAPWHTLITNCDLTVVADWSSETVIYLAMTFTKGEKTDRMIYVVQPAGETYTFGLGTDTNSFNITSVSWKADETVASEDQTSFTVGTTDCALGYTGFNPVWVSEKLNAGDKLVIDGNISFDADAKAANGVDAATYKVPIINFMQNNYSLALWRVDDWMNNLAWYVSNVDDVAQGGDHFNSSSWGTDADKSGTFVLTFDWTNANSLVVTIAITVGEDTKTNMLTLTNPNVDNFSFGLGGEGIYMTSSSIVYTRAQA